ncbi:MAG: preprotein translocase subunit SecG [Oscillospiraceae bacterium]|jgi:preprotein translocase subunit SecG|nr:preprotein translocase subunit SecG [Oscillospiraceae bacterium]
MDLFEIISGSVLLLIGVLTIILCLLQDQKAQQNMTSAITGANNESFYGKNAGETKEAAFKKLTKILAVLFFLGALTMTVVPALIAKFSQS